MLLERTPNPPDEAGVISWVHFGDLHMEGADGQNYKDLLALVQKLNATFARSISFAFLPGDNADKGSAAQYVLVRSGLDKLQLPWHAIVGDHDVHEKSFHNFLHYLEPATYYSFIVGDLHFYALNAFTTPEPKSFDLSDEQLDWLETLLKALPENAHAILLLHCYPTDLNRGAERLHTLIEGRRVLLIDMGHTHYNEVANDGATLYTATRSTGQIEEGPVGFSVTNIDGNVVSWRFLPFTDSSLVMITSPTDERFLTTSLEVTNSGPPTVIRAKFWGDLDGVALEASIGASVLPMTRVGDSQVWQAELKDELVDGVHDLTVTAQLRNGTSVRDGIRLRVGPTQRPARDQRDQDNALDAWPERGLLGTQLGPNKNGKKW